jgi:ribosomal protein S18 acetylase RimI-like enzyme
MTSSNTALHQDMFRHDPHRPPASSSAGTQLRIGPWRDRDDVLLVGPMPGVPVDSDGVRDTLGQLRDRGIHQVFTHALAPGEQHTFLAAGFEPHEHLHLLRHDLSTWPAPAALDGHRIRRGTRLDYPAVLDLDGRAFDEFWRFDLRSLVEARRATPVSRFRVAVRTTGLPAASAGGRALGYAVTGRARRTCYLQRLAVHPDHQHHGLGTALIIDALHWARVRGAASVLVNTQERNQTAYELYLRLGFVSEPGGLEVLRWSA